jgi:hypothetical protein
MFGSQSRPAVQLGSPANERAKEVPKMADQAANRQLKPTEPFGKRRKRRGRPQIHLRRTMRPSRSRTRVPAKRMFGH